jgi:hypothetical protein
MNDPERLIQGGDDLEQAMLRAGAGDGPSEASRRKVAAGLGIVAAPHGALWRAADLLKWIGGSAILLALVGGAAHFLRPRNAPALDSSASSPAPATNETIATPSPGRAPAESLADLPATPAADPPVVHAPPVVRASPKIVPTSPPAVAAPAKTKRNASTLDAETALLDGARASVRAGRPNDALRTLDGYDAQFPDGLLAPEATVVRIEALVKSGDKAGARVLGQAFLRGHPDSPLADRVRSLTNS